MLVKRIGDWYVDYRLDLAYRLLDGADEQDRQMVQVYNKKDNSTTIEYFSEDFIKDLIKAADKTNSKKEVNYDYR